MNPHNTERGYWLVLTFGIMFLTFVFVTSEKLPQIILGVSGIVCIIVSLFGIKLARMSPDHPNEPYYVENFSLVQSFANYSFNDLKNLKQHNELFMLTYPETREVLTRQNIDIDKRLQELKNAWMIKR